MNSSNEGDRLVPSDAAASASGLAEVSAATAAPEGTTAPLSGGELPAADAPGPAAPEHRHLVGGCLRAHLPANQLHAGQRVFVVPKDARTPRGARLGMIPSEGTELVINDYLVGCAQRGAVSCFALAEPESQDFGREG